MTDCTCRRLRDVVMVALEGGELDPCPLHDVEPTAVPTRRELRGALMHALEHPAPTPAALPLNASPEQMAQAFGLAGARVVTDRDGRFDPFDPPPMAA
jgi:hypothetical protein